MDCGDGLGCQILGILFEHDKELRELTELLLNVSNQAAGIPEHLLGTIKTHISNLVALAAFSFGVWKWYVYRDKILHQRLFSYLRKSDVRLFDGQQYILEALQRPAPRKKPALPLFANKKLRRVLKREKWDSAFLASNVEGSAQKLIDAAMHSAQRQLTLAEDATELLRKQLATGHLISGALAASHIHSSIVDQRGHDALASFRAALQVPGHERNIVAKELEAHQLRRLGLLEEAREAYVELEHIASTHSDYRTQRLLTARAKRYQAELHQLDRSTPQADGTLKFLGSDKAAALLYPRRPNTALAIRANFAPFREWELIEQAENHLITAFVAHNKKDKQVERRQIVLAEQCYRLAQQQSKHWSWFSRARKHLLDAATAGAKQATAAKSGTYDALWMTSPALLDQAKQKPDCIGSARGDQRIASTL